MNLVGSNVILVVVVIDVGEGTVHDSGEDWIGLDA